MSWKNVIKGYDKDRKSMRETPLLSRIKANRSQKEYEENLQHRKKIVKHLKIDVANVIRELEEFQEKYLYESLEDSDVAGWNDESPTDEDIEEISEALGKVSVLLQD